jgi:hypothetical protein
MLKISFSDTEEVCAEYALYSRGVYQFFFILTGSESTERLHTDKSIFRTSFSSQWFIQNIMTAT